MGVFKFEFRKLKKAAGRHLKKPLNQHISVTFRTVFDQIWYGNAQPLRKTKRLLKFHCFFSKSQKGHRLQWFINLRAHDLSEGDDTFHGARFTFTVIVLFCLVF